MASWSLILHVCKFLYYYASQLYIKWLANYNACDIVVTTGIDTNGYIVNMYAMYIITKLHQTRIILKYNDSELPKVVTKGLRKRLPIQSSQNNKRKAATSCRL